MRRRAAPLAALLALTLAPGCSSDRGARTDPVSTSARADLSTSERIDAIHRAAEAARQGQADPTVLRLAMKKLAWSLDTPEAVRAAALETILWDEDHAEDSLKLVRDMLPTEPGRQVVAVMSTAAADHQWLETTPALVRSLGRPVEGVKDEERAEYKALASLHTGVSIDRVVLDVFLNPQTDPGPSGLRLDMRTREAAWDVLGRLQPQTGQRGALLDLSAEGDAEGLVVLGKLRMLRDELGVTPRSGEELRWAIRLVDQREGELRDWWAQARAAASTVFQDADSRELRHIEPMRWAGEHHAGWLNADRAGLLDELAARLRGRQVYTRTRQIRGNPNANAERLSFVRDALPWGDVLTLLVLDEATRDPAIASAIFEAADEDHRDETSEHGGVLWSDARGFHAQGFSPRGTATPDDRRFTAPREMIDYSTAALAHFHFHVADWRNRDFAGPSPGDLDYAARFGRTCVVLTGIGRDELDVDAYFPTGVVLDLGGLARPATRP